MGHRLSKIYTRTGDAGETGLGDGSRTSKDSLRVEAFGTVDELNSVVGTILVHEVPEPSRSYLIAIQHDLLDLGGELCIPGYSAVTNEMVERLEGWLDELNDELEPLKEFILPGGGPAAAACHHARTVSRRAERRVVTLADAESVSEPALGYLNRLSDLLFVMARHLNRVTGHGDVLWRHDRGVGGS